MRREGVATKTYPDMAKYGTVRTLTVPVEILRSNSRDSHGDPDKAVLVDADPVNVEPRQAALGGPPGTSLAAAARLEPVEGPHPALDRLHEAEVLLLLVQVGGDVVA